MSLETPVLSGEKKKELFLSKSKKVLAALTAALEFLIASNALAGVTVTNETIIDGQRKSRPAAARTGEDIKRPNIKGVPQGADLSGEVAQQLEMPGLVAEDGEPLSKEGKVYQPGEDLDGGRIIRENKN